MFALGFRRRCFHQATETNLCWVWTDAPSTPDVYVERALPRPRPTSLSSRCSRGAGLSAARTFSKAFFLLEKSATAQPYRFPAARDLCLPPSARARANHTAARGTTAKAIAAAPRKIESPAWAQTPTWSPAR